MASESARACAATSAPVAWARPNSASLFGDDGRSDDAGDGVDGDENADDGGGDGAAGGGEYRAGDDGDCDEPRGW